MTEYTQIVDFDDLSKLSCVRNGHIIDISNHCKANKLGNDKMCELVSVISGIHVPNINENALRLKIARVKRNEIDKRGSYLKAFKNELFHVPTCTSTTTSTSEAKTTEISQMVIDSLGNELAKTQKELVKKTVQLTERRTKVTNLQEQTKSLKRKLDIRKDFMPSMAKRLKVSEDKISKLKRKNSELKQENLKVKAETRKAKQEIDKLSKNKNKLNENLKCEKQKAKRMKLEKSESEKELLLTEAKQAEIKDLNMSVDYLQSLLEDNSELVLFDEVSKKFNTELIECVMNLTSCKVSSEQVGNVISEVCKLCGKQPNRLPSRSTIDRIVDSKLSVSHKQIAQILKSKENITLYSDETRKYGHTLETFAVTDAEQNSYVLGLREMFNKSSQSTLETLQQILRDIDAHCHLLETCDKKDSYGFNILSNIKNTMSDRAATEKSFHNLLQQYRKEILPQVLDTWSDLTDDDKELCASMNNFYCGLHLLVAMADVTENTLKKFESTYHDGREVGSAALPELKRFHKYESGTVRLLRTASKALSLGGDEKSGVNCAWNTYLKSKNLKNTIVRFKHNRFNLIFLLGQSLYYHHEDIKEFLLKVHGTGNTLLKAVSLDVQETVYLAGLKCLGLIAKYISSPLWRLIEDKSSHILSMNEHYETLVTFLESCSKDASTFLTGENTPFDVANEYDPVLQKLLMPCEEIDKICIPMTESVALALCELFKRMVPEHLAGGKFHSLGEERKKEMLSTKKHNKLPEFIFGQLDHLMHYRPNATALVNEIFIMYNHNKSKEWLDQLEPEEKKKILEDSRQEGRQFREKFKERLKEIEVRRLEAQKIRQLENEKKEKERIRKSENMTNDVCFYGLWQSATEIDEGLERLSTDTERQQALESQLKFRKNVLRQTHIDKKIFTLSSKQANGKYAKHSLETLKANVLKLVEAAGLRMTVEKKLPDVHLLVGKCVNHKFANGKTYKGKVICVVAGFPNWYNVQYENDEAIYVYNLIEDYKRGDLRIIVTSSEQND